jgi:hypothetical protein
MKQSTIDERRGLTQEFLVGAAHKGLHFSNPRKSDPNSEIT